MAIAATFCTGFQKYTFLPFPWGLFKLGVNFGRFCGHSYFAPSGGHHEVEGPHALRRRRLRSGGGASKQAADLRQRAPDLPGANATAWWAACPAPWASMTAQPRPQSAAGRRIGWPGTCCQTASIRERAGWRGSVAVVCARRRSLARREREWR